MNKPFYTPAQMQGRFIACSVLLDPPSLGAVIHATGPHEGLPVLYNQIVDAEEDFYFDPTWDKVLPASEYYQRIENKNYKF